MSPPFLIHLSSEHMDNLVTPPERHATMRLRDGRRLAWFEWGPTNGSPVLFCTGAGMSGSLGFGTPALHELGLRLIAIDRPGLGLSDPHPHKTLSSWVSDMHELIVAQRLSNVGAVGFSQGAPFAFALASHGLLKSLAIVAGQDELAHPLTQPLLYPDVARMVTVVEQDAAAFEQQIADSASARWLWNFIITTSATGDRAVYTHEPFSAAYQRALHEGFAQGPHGYARDLVNALGSWPFALDQITTPVDLWYGAMDTSTVHSPDFGATLASRLPRARRTVDAEGGGSLLWTRARDVLAGLQERMVK